MTHSKEKAACLNLKGLVLIKEKEYLQAIKEFSYALDMQKSILGENNIEVASTLNNIALARYNLGDLNRAESLYEESIKIKTSILGEHLDVATSYYNLGVLYYYQKAFSKAEKVLQKALEIQNSKLDTSSIYIADTKIELAKVYLSRNKFSESKSMLKESLRIFNENPEMFKSKIDFVTRGLQYLNTKI